MIPLSEKNIFVYDGDTRGEFIIADLVSMMDLDGKNFIYLSNNTVSPPYHIFNCRKVYFKNIDVFEETVKENLFRVDYLMLEVAPIQPYLEAIDFIDIPIIFLNQMSEGFTSFHTSRIPKDFNIYFFYRKNRYQSISKILDETQSEKWKHYKIKDIRKDHEYDFESLRNRFVRDRRLDDLLS